MKNLVEPILLACICVGPVWAGAAQPSKDLTDNNAVKQIEQDIGDAMLSVDIDKLGRLYADDFATLGATGKIITKRDLLLNFASSRDKLESFELGAIDVQVFGNVAVAHGSVTEKRVRDGKDVSGEVVWMDLLARRDGKWVVVRSEGTRVQ